MSEAEPWSREGAESVASAVASRETDRIVSRLDELERGLESVAVAIIAGVLVSAERDTRTAVLERCVEAAEQLMELSRA